MTTNPAAPGQPELSEVVASRPRAVPGEAAIILALTMLLTVVPLIPTTAVLPAGMAVAALTMLAWHRRAPAAASFGLLFVTCLILGLVGLGPQQAVLACAFAIYVFVIRRCDGCAALPPGSGGAPWTGVSLHSARVWW